MPHYLLKKSVPLRSAKMYVIIWKEDLYSMDKDAKEKIFIHAYKRRTAARRSLDILDKLERTGKWPREKFVHWRNGLMVVPEEDKEQLERYNLVIQTRCTHFVSV